MKASSTGLVLLLLAGLSACGPAPEPPATRESDRKLGCIDRFPDGDRITLWIKAAAAETRSSLSPPSLATEWMVTVCGFRFPFDDAGLANLEAKLSQLGHLPESARTDGLERELIVRVDPTAPVEVRLRVLGIAVRSGFASISTRPIPAELQTESR